MASDGPPAPEERPLAHTAMSLDDPLCPRVVSRTFTGLVQDTCKLHRLHLMKAIDFQAYQAELDAAFHQRGDPIPSGHPAHEELLSFMVKLHAHRMHQQIKSTMETQPATQTESKNYLTAPESKLGIPMDYDPRFRMNSSFVVDKNRMAACIRGIERKLHSEEGSGHGWTAKAIIDEYKAMLPVYHDFCNKKKLQQLKKIGEDRKSLPISSFEDAIVDAVRSNRAVVVAGSTGCGKSTQVPQFLIKAGFNRVVCTQPRRISAIALARRVSHETLQAHGSQIAYKIRFSGSMTSASKITFMTEGILLRMLASDPSLKSFDVVVIDEVHERHLNTDFLLALLRAVMIQRPDLRLVLMSATINFSAYSDYFGGAPVIQVPGRLYPITLEYVRHKEEREKDPDGKRDRDQSKGGITSKKSYEESINPAPYLKLLKRIDGELPSSQRGDMLIFVAGTQDIDTLYSALRPYALETKAWLVLKLHASLSVDDQDKVFDKAPEGVRKCIISTNIAETSVTIDGIRFVVDSGRAKEMIAMDGIASLQEGWISKASADQRKGRAGRTGPGRCYRMYSEKDFEGFRAFNIPEIQRIRIENLVLQIKSLAGSGMNPRSFGFLDPPSDESLEAAVVKAKQAGALSPSEALTPLGSILASLPLDINVGKLLILGSLLGISSPTLTIAAALSVQSPFSRVPEDDERMKSARLELMHAEGDAFTLLKLFDEWVAVKATGRAREEEPQSSIHQGSNEGSKGQRGEGGGRMISITSRRWCKRAGVEEQRLYEIAKLRAQYEDLMRDAGIVKKLSGSKRGLRGGELHAARSKLRDMQHERDRLRGTRVLNASAEEEEGEEGEEREEREAGRGDNIDDLDMQVHLDLSKVHKEASCPLTQADMQLLKVIIASAFTPRVALPDPKNSQRRSQDCRFSTNSHADLVIHPGSSLRDPTSLRAQDCLFYYELLETRRMYLCGLTPTPALPSLLISSTEVDVDESCSRFIFDGWIMIRLLDDSGPKLLLWSISLRTRIQRLLAARLSLNLKGFHQSPGCSLDQQGDVYLYPWQAAASGCASEIQSQLERMPKDLRLGLVTMAAQTNVLSDAMLATARWWGVELDPSPLDINEERLAEELVSFMALSVSFNMEKLQGGLKTTSHYRLPSLSPATDSRGVPRVKSGIHLTGYVNWGSLLGCDSQFASHQLQPAMRRHWSCPGCEARGILSFEEIQQHLSICSRAKGIDKRQREEGGYEGYSADSSLKPNESIDKLMSSEMAVQWGRRVVSQSEQEEIEDGGPSVQALPTNASFFRCDVCGMQSLLTPVQQLQHKKACGAQK